MHQTRSQRHSPNLPLLAFAYLCLAGSVCSRNEVFSYNESRFGDVSIVRSERVWQCDRVRCPQDTEQCVVRKSISPRDPETVMRRNLCLSKNGDKLVDRRFKEEASQYGNNDILIVSTKDGSQYSSTYMQNLYDIENVEENLQFMDRVDRNVTENLERAAELMRRNMAELQRQIENAFRHLPFYG
ncbi:uncharacterized protein LOC118739238 [Rhagoletis pomonella]|uniref:uncharacterized protein LOC118739238 n=1 Tax=Rhagoletis pomonella TaxID=28610 RepID=UPI001782667D|nr:uncharacterized protein LOC118739238 [Rhagoletis pomonella]XP_036326343.1 uncharacterized protein LOC118739238 [Rhagoletis pomonella]XP_036326344.1 uncharacterized protein LOC118739238 [Rhagoletis pomonella]